MVATPHSDLMGSVETQDHRSETSHLFFVPLFLPGRAMASKSPETQETARVT